MSTVTIFYRGTRDGRNAKRIRDCLVRHGLTSIEWNAGAGPNGARRDNLTSSEKAVLAAAGAAEAVPIV
jgi:hypothetical protein